jgi:hypothetical protein
VRMRVVLVTMPVCACICVCMRVYACEKYSDMYVPHARGVGHHACDTPVCACVCV